MSLKLWWKLDESNGTAISDSSLNGITGTVYNGASWVPGLLSNALSFDGVNDYARTNAVNSTWSLGNYFSFSFWFKAINWTGGPQILLYKGDGGNKFYVYGGYGWNLGIEIDHGAAYDLCGQANDSNYIQNNVWYHVVAIQNDTTVSIFKNKVAPTYKPTCSSSRRPFDSASGYFALACDPSLNNQFFGGLIDQVKVYDHVLSTQEISDLYDEGQQAILCWNYTAKYKNSDRLFRTNGSGKFPSTLKVPSNVDINSGIMMDEGNLIDPSQYKII